LPDAIARRFSVTEPADRDLHQRQTLILAVAILASVVAAVIGVAAMAPLLNHYGFVHFPLGYYLAAQGLLIGITAAAFWFVRRQDHLDRMREESEEL
jgi:putative solute:sodium symporter small subunit